MKSTTASATLDSVNREARERLHPSITNPNWLVLRARRKFFANWIERVNGGRLRILDVGGRIQPYRTLFGGRVHEYYALDIVAGPCVTVVGRAEFLPFAAGLFDVVLCTQTLEYIPRPQDAVDEIYRVLRPGGHLFLSVPAIFPRDSDPEYWRFLPSSIELLLQNFSEIDLAAEGSSISGFFRTINVFLAHFSPRFLRAVLRYSLIPALNLLAVVLESLARTDNDRLTANFSALARK